jgi:hypothetical protein
MKKTLLLSVVASTMIMAGGDIAPVEPVVETPAAVAAASGWDFNGQGVVYYQTTDGNGNGSLFDQGPKSTTSGWAAAGAGLQLNATNKDVIAGIGAGATLNAISSLGLHREVVSALVQNAGGTTDGLTGGALAQAYLTYGMGNTSLKVGRQYLPKSLSPFAFSEGWNMFKNSFDAVLVVNSDVPDTTLVGAYVTRANNSVGNLNDFNRIQGGDGTAMFTAQNKSIDGLTLTGTFYNVFDVAQSGEDAQALWGDAKFALGDYSIALQGGQIDPTSVNAAWDKTTAFGAKIAGNFGMFDASVAYSSVDDGTLTISNIAGSGVKTPLYTQAVLNQNTIKKDSDTFKVAAGAKALGGKFGVYYINSDLGAKAIGSTFGTGATGAGTYQEIALTYKAKVTDNATVFAAFINQNDDRQGADDAQNFFRVWGRYNF